MVLLVLVRGLVNYLHDNGGVKIHYNTCIDYKKKNNVGHLYKDYFKKTTFI
jgi:hypothetical protein